MQEGLLELENGGDELAGLEAEALRDDPWQVLEGWTDLFEREE